MNFLVYAWDTELKDPPDFVKTITIIAPDNSTFELTTAQHWSPYAGDRNYSADFKGEQFKSKNIVGGTYRCTVKDKTGKSITVTDAVALSFLEPPLITYPTEGLTVLDPLTIKWKAVSGAAKYRIQLWNETYDEPVFWWWQDELYVTGTQIALPTGSLRPNSSYRLSVEARADLQDADKRSRSKWIKFKSAP
jgi:hypothetical protein